MKKVCSKCKIPKELEEFNKSKNKKDGFQDYCKSCKKTIDENYYSNNTELFLKRNKEYAEKRFEEIKEIFINRVCEKCGEDRYWVLDFHHKEKNEKEFNIATNKKTFSNKRILNEIEKCITLCSSCHRDFHHLEREEGITIKQYLKNKMRV